MLKGKRSNGMDWGSGECMTLETRMFLKAHLPSSSDTPGEYTSIIEEATDEYWNGSKKRCPKRALSGVASGEARRKKAKLNAATHKQKKRALLEGEENEEIDDDAENVTSRCTPISATDVWFSRTVPKQSRPSNSPSY
jgi:hypothetical protein